MKAALKVCSVLMLAAAIGWVLFSGQKAAVKSRPLLSVRFDHADHTATSCVACHHNFADSTGPGSCYSCHKYTDDIALEIESMFHNFCRDCHVERKSYGEDAGPLRQCSHCHD